MILSEVTRNQDMTITGLFPKSQNPQLRVELPKSEVISSLEEYQNRVMEARRVNDGKMEAFYLILLGCLYQMRCEPEYAFERFQEALKADSSNPDVHMFLGHYYHAHLKDYKRAEQEYQDAIGLAIPGGVMVHKAYNCLGMVYLEQNQADKAEEMMLLSCLDYSGKFGYDLSLVQAFLERGGDMEPVLSFLNCAHEKEPENEKIQKLMKEAWVKNGKPQKGAVTHRLLQGEQVTQVRYYSEPSRIRLTAAKEIILG